MTHYHPCVNCKFEKADCDRRNVVRAGLRGLGVTSVKFNCPFRKPMFFVGQRVAVTWPVLSPGAGDYGTDAVDYESWPATVVAERQADRKFQILVDDADSNEGTPIRGYLKNETLYAKVRSWRLHPLDEPARTVCRECQGTLDTNGAVRGCHAYDDGPYSWRPNLCIASVGTDPEGGDNSLAPFIGDAVGVSRDAQNTPQVSDNEL